MDTQLISLFEAAQANAKAILPLLQKLEGYSPVAYTAEIEARLVAIVPQMISILASDTEDASSHEDSYVCTALGKLGRKASSAIPALFSHAERFPRNETNVLAIGKIGGPGVVRRLIDWTYWSGRDYDRKRTDAVCSAIRMLGEEAVQDLLAIIESDTEDAHTRSRAILNLYENTAYPPELLIPIFIREIARPDCYCQCLEALSSTLVEIGKVFPSLAIEQIEASFFSNWSYFQRYIDILSNIGYPAVPTLVRALEQRDRVHGTYEIIEALSEIGGPGIEYLFSTLVKEGPYSHRQLAINVIPACGRPFLDTLVQVIENPDTSGCAKSLAELAVGRLGDFNDELEQVDRYLRTLHCHPDLEVVNAADQSLKRINARRRQDCKS